MNPILPITMQSLSTKLGTELAIRSCAPVAFYMLLKANGYLPVDLSPEDFVFSLDRGQLSTDFANPNNWSRPALSRYLRHKYGASIVSWQFKLNFVEPNFENMLSSGYLETPYEVEFYKKHIKSRTIEEIVQSGFPVITTVLSGFNTPDNESVHAVIVTDWGPDGVELIDPDARNTNHSYPPESFVRFVSSDGGGSIVLPKP